MGRIQGFGELGWERFLHLYVHELSQNVAFPALARVRQGPRVFSQVSNLSVLEITKAARLLEVAERAVSAPPLSRVTVVVGPVTRAC